MRTIVMHMAPVRPDSRVLRFTVTTSLLAMPAMACHRGGPPGGVYVNEGPQELGPPAATTAPPADGGGATQDGGAAEGATEGANEPVAETSPPLDITPSNPTPEVPIRTNTTRQDPPPEKPRVIVNPGPTDRPGATPTKPRP